MRLLFSLSRSVQVPSSTTSSVPLPITDTTSAAQSLANERHAAVQLRRDSDGHWSNGEVHLLHDVCPRRGHLADAIEHCIVILLIEFGQ